MGERVELKPVIKAIDEAARYGCPGAQSLSFDSALSGELGKPLQQAAVWATKRAEQIEKGEVANLNPNEIVDARYLFYNSKTFMIHYAQQTGQSCNITLGENSGQTIYQS